MLRVPAGVASEPCGVAAPPAAAAAAHVTAAAALNTSAETAGPDAAPDSAAAQRGNADAALLQQQPPASSQQPMLAGTDSSAGKTVRLDTLSQPALLSRCRQLTYDLQRATPTSQIRSTRAEKLAAEVAALKQQLAAVQLALDAAGPGPDAQLYLEADEKAAEHGLPGLLLQLAKVIVSGKLDLDSLIAQRLATYGTNLDRDDMRGARFSALEHRFLAALRQAGGNAVVQQLRGRGAQGGLHFAHCQHVCALPCLRAV